jgi:hypothetical protein
MNSAKKLLLSISLLLSLVISAHAQQATLQTLFETGPKSQRLNFVVFSEGYTASQLDANFRKDAAGLVEAILATEPYVTYRNYINVYAIVVASNESGADYPVDGVVRDTYFGASYGASGIERLLTINSAGRAKLYALLDELLPEYDLPLVIVNDSRYGGSGGAIAVASVEAQASEVVVHEMGHTLAGLGDEYDYAGSTPRESPNTTQTTDPALIRWRHWIDAGTPIPTPETAAYNSVVGLFEGAAYNTTGWYRPTLTSNMQNSGQPAFAVNEEALALAFVRGTPKFRSSFPSGNLTSNDGQPIHFSVTAMRPAGSVANPVSWYLDGVPQAGTAALAPLIRRGESWKYLASATAAPSNWASLQFSDTSWPSGLAPLGYGDGNEATVIPGGPSTTRYATTYFRKTINVSNPSAFTALTLELRRDDGAVVYLNGTEIYRSNMASGVVTYSTLAATTDADAVETYYYDARLPITGLLTGANVIAVEVHQSSLTSSDLKLDLALNGELSTYATQQMIPAGSVWKYRDTGVDPGPGWRSRTFDDSLWASGPAQLGYGDGDESTVVGYGTSTSNRYITTWFRKSFNVTNAAEFTALDLNLRRDDGAVVYLNDSELVRSNMPSGAITASTLASTTAADDGATWNSFSVPSTALTNGSNVVSVEVHQSAVTSTDLSFDLSIVGRREPITQPWIPQGSLWKYWDRGPTAANWAAPSFNDTGWTEGPAELGYGDGDEGTVMGYGGNTSNRYPTYYFRRAFDVAVLDPSVILKIAMKFDDGAVIYLNGTEVARANMGWGAIGYSNLAGKESPSDGDDFNYFEIGGAHLVSGRNVIAVEVHQFSLTSSDVSFDLELTPQLRNEFTLNPGSLSPGLHTVEARYVDATGKIRQDPADYSVAQQQWQVTVASSADSDLDTLSDAWEMEKLGTMNYAATDDPDGDGNSNETELIAGTHPNLASSRFTISAPAQATNGRMLLEWTSVPGRLYQVEAASATSSLQWTRLYETYGAVAPALTTRAELPAPVIGQRAFYRARVLAE